MLVMEEKQNFFLWCNYVKYSFNSSWYNAVSELVPIIFTSTAVSLTCSVAALLCSLLSSLFTQCFPQRKNWLTGIFLPQISNPACVVKYNLDIFMNPIMRTSITACCFYYAGVD